MEADEHTLCCVFLFLLLTPPSFLIIYTKKKIDYRSGSGSFLRVDELFADVNVLFPVTTPRLKPS